MSGKMTNYDKRIKPEFVMECAKLGKVKIFSRQVVISSDEYGSLNLEALEIPDCYRVQYVNTFATSHSERPGVSITLVLAD